MKEVQVKLAERSYPIFIDSGFASLREKLAAVTTGSLCLLTNPKVKRHCLGLLQKLLGNIPIVMIPDGERHKNLKTVERVYHQLIRHRVARQTTLLLLGGGVVGDLGGFAAATFMRGIRFVQLPTTLVAQVDSSIGGKLGVDLPEGKNLIGAFEQPRLVYANVSLLKTLSRRDLVGGLAEVLKYGVIKDKDFFQWVLANKENIFNGDIDTLTHVVATSARIKAEVVSSDERESGLRMILNFGHTFGHALERITRYRKYTHGEAVAIGMVMAAELSQKMGHCRTETCEAIRAGIASLGLPTEIPHLPAQRWLDAIGVDKKRRGDTIHFVFAQSVGQVMVQEVAPEKLVRLL